LTVSNSGNCMDRFSAKLSVGSLVCNADFVVYVDSSSNTVYFRARQKFPENSYHWVFGDGTVANTPTHVQKFSHPGYYSAVLTVSNKKAGCLESRKENILVGKKSPVGEASFIYVSGEDNKVAFTNQSLGQELSYFWDFNDGSDPSKDKDAVHSYALPGYYNVCLTVNTKDGLQNTHCEKIFAGTDTKDQCLARFEYSLSRDGLEIACVDRSLGNPDQWKWTYNEGGATTDKDPKWSTNTPAYVRIHQTIFNSANGCQDDAFGLVNMGAKSKLKAGFGYTIKKDNKKADSYPVDFVGVSLGDAGKLKWSFGDGTYDSTTINPTHIYPGPGTYEVCLTILNSATGTEDEDCQMITVDAASFRKEIASGNVGLNAYPNPFSENTRIEIQLSENSEIDLSVYDLMGRKVKTIARDQRQTGAHTFIFNGLDLERGNYYLILQTKSGMARQLISIIR
ncbi:MAG: PKD domain-containing protein, partial [Bacteroidales bacterium]|nr:PKD domain-containing protein [Bacteroidales bacterium]